MYKLVITELAQSDLDSIVNYIAVHLANPVAAGHFLDRVEECYRSLKTNPFIYSKSNDIRLEKEGFRKAVIKNYVLMFKVNEKSKTVIIYRLFYGARDYLKLL